MTAAELLKIFYSNRSGGSDWQNLDEIAWMINEGMISVAFSCIATNENFTDKLDENLERKLIKTGESLAHMALKLLASKYLIGQFNIPSQDIFYEYPLIGFEVDLVDKDLHYPTECGDTNALKLEKYFNLGSTNKMFVLPYPHLGNVLVYEFTPKPSFYKYIKFKNNYSNQQNSKLR